MSDILGNTRQVDPSIKGLKKISKKTDTRGVLPEPVKNVCRFVSNIATSRFPVLRSYFQFIYKSKPLKRPKKAVFGLLILLFSTFSHFSFTKF